MHFKQQNSLLKVQIVKTIAPYLEQQHWVYKLAKKGDPNKEICRHVVCTKKLCQCAYLVEKLHLANSTATAVICHQMSNDG